MFLCLSYPIRFLCLLKHCSMPFFCRCKVFTPAKICFYSCLAVVRFLRLLNMFLCLCCDVGWLVCIAPFGVRGQQWLGHRTWLVTSMTSLALRRWRFVILCSSWVNAVMMFVIIVPPSGKGFVGFYTLFIY
jgi:hypothetical protein